MKMLKATILFGGLFLVINATCYLAISLLSPFVFVGIAILFGLAFYFGYVIPLEKAALRAQNDHDLPNKVRSEDVIRAAEDAFGIKITVRKK